MGQTITLSVLEFDILWEHLQLGPFPPILDIDSHGATLDERAELAATAWESLADKDLGWPNRVDSRVVFRLRQLAHPEWELDARMRFTATGPGTRALISANTSTATIAVLDATRLTLRTAPADLITPEALALLPRHPAAGGPSITLPAHTLDAATAHAGTPAALANTLASAGLGQSESRTLATVASTAIRSAHFGAARTRRFERRRRANHVVSVYDTPPGRYLCTRKPSNGTHWVTLLSGTDHAIARQLDELRESL